MNESAGTITAAWDIQGDVLAAGFEFCFIGGLALQRWGEPRYTQDVDLTLMCPFGDERAVSATLVEIIPPRIESAEDFAAEARVYLGQTASGVPVDIAFGAIPFERRCVDRSSSFEFDDRISLRTCSAEDLVVMKTFANRERDWADIEGILVRQASALNWTVIDDELVDLLKIRGGQPVRDRLDALRERCR